MVQRQQNDLVYKTLLCGEGMMVVWIWEFRERMGDIESLSVGNGAWPWTGRNTESLVIILALDSQAKLLTLITLSS